MKLETTEVVSMQHWNYDKLYLWGRHRFCFCLQNVIKYQPEGSWLKHGARTIRKKLNFITSSFYLHIFLIWGNCVMKESIHSLIQMRDLQGCNRILCEYVMGIVRTFKLDKSGVRQWENGFKSPGNWLIQAICLLYF
jgi:hypothetical protein